jgi:hypothetical protein
LRKQRCRPACYGELPSQGLATGARTCLVQIRKPRSRTQGYQVCRVLFYPGLCRAERRPERPLHPAPLAAWAASRSAGAEFLSREEGSSLLLLFSGSSVLLGDTVRRGPEAQRAWASERRFKPLRWAAREKGDGLGLRRAIAAHSSRLPTLLAGL